MFQQGQVFRLRTRGSDGNPRWAYRYRVEIAAWRMTIPAGHRFEATQALRQVLARAVSWGLLDVNPAKLGVENPQRRYTEKRRIRCQPQRPSLLKPSTTAVLVPKY